MPIRHWSIFVGKYRVLMFWLLLTVCICIYIVRVLMFWLW